MIDGTFDPLDKIFSESEMLTILRSTPVGQYLQPIGDWKDGLDLPFVLLREDVYISVEIGSVEPSDNGDVLPIGPP